MARNTTKKSGEGVRHGAVKDRSEIYNSKTEQWVKRDTEAGRFMDVKSDGSPFKGVRKEASAECKRSILYPAGKGTINKKDALRAVSSLSDAKKVKK
jgi:hypothetical protein